MPIPKIVVTIALMAAQTALQMTQKIRGPRLDDLKTTTAEYGTPIPRFWGKRKFNCPVIWAADLIETRHTSKGKAGKNTQYKYFADFAILICDHEIDAVTKIWMDEKLVYQTTAVGPVSVGAAAGLTVGGNMRVYLGTETQDADPLMEAWCDDRYGANSCPAYRGSSIIVFERLPVNNFGNRIPNITVEAVSSKAAAYPHEQLANGITLNGACYRRNVDGTLDFTRLYLGVTNGFQVWDVPSRTLLIDSDVGAGAIAANSNGTFYGQNSSHTCLISEGGAVVTICGSLAGGTWVTNAGLFGTISSVAGSIRYPGDDINDTDETVTSFHPSWYFDDLDGKSWAVGGQRSGTSYTTGFGFYDLAAGQEYLVSAATSGPTLAFDNGEDQFFVWQDDTIYLVDKVAMAVVTGPVSIASFNGHVEAPFVGVAQGSKTIWIGFIKYSATDLSTLQTESSSSWGTGTSNDTPIYDPVNDAIWTKGTLDSGITIRYLNRVSPLGVTLKTVVDAVSGWVGLTGQDSSALTQPVLGYSVTQGTGKDMIAPLLDIHDVDCRPHDFTVQFVNRGSSPSGTILTEDFVRDGDNRYKVTIQQDTDLPRKLTFNFADNDHEQQPNNAIAQRPFDAVDSSREETVDLSTWVDTADGAQQKGDRYLRRIWNSREKISNSLTAQKLALEPGDVTALSLDGSVRNVRLDKLTKAQGVLQCEWIRDETSFAALNSATTGAEMEADDPQTITIPAPVKGFIIDAPLIQDADNDVNPVLYAAAGSYNTGTDTGVTVNRGDDGTYDELVASIDSTSLATWGYASSALATANPNLWDRGNTFDVSVYGTLTSATEAEIDADPTLNLIALGQDDAWEYLNFATATLTGTSGTANTYTLSGFKRGRRGTEGNVSAHAIGDQLVLLNGAAAMGEGSDDIGDSMSFKIQAIGRDVDAAPAIDLTYDANTLKPYAPARIIWTTDGTDLFGEIIRRTRVGGAWVGGSTIPLSENSEAYEVDVYNGATFKRTITVTGTNTFTYTAAEMAADGNSVSVPPPVNVYQMSEAVGRGFALAA